MNFRIGCKNFFKFFNGNFLYEDKGFSDHRNVSFRTGESRQITYERTRTKIANHLLVIGSQDLSFALLNEKYMSSNLATGHYGIVGHTNLGLQAKTDIADKVFGIVIFAKWSYKLTVLMVKNLFDQTPG